MLCHCSVPYLYIQCNSIAVTPIYIIISCYSWPCMYPLSPSYHQYQNCHVPAEYFKHLDDVADDNVHGVTERFVGNLKALVKCSWEFVN